MAVEMIVRRTGDYRDARLVPLRSKGVALLKKHGAISHKFGYYHSGSHAGRIHVAIGYPDVAAHERAMQGMSQDPEWSKVAAELEGIAPLEESYLAIVTEEQ